MLEKLRLVEERYMEMEERAAQPDFYADPKAATKLLKEQKQLEPIIKAYRAYKAAEQAMAEARELMDAGDPELKALCQEEFSAAKQDCERLEHELKILLLPRDPNDDKSVIMEIRGGVGGEESALFAHSLYRMYTMYAQRRGWQVSLLNYNETELGGVKEADFEISGEGAYSRLKFESGVHRVQRVPETESGGRVHTSTATVAVLPEMEEAEVDIRPEDIEMQVYRSSGAGGQHINKTLSWPVRRNARRCRTAKNVCRCWPPSSMRSSRRRSAPPSRANAAARLAPGCATSASAPIIFRRAASPTTGSD